MVYCFLEFTWGGGELPTHLSHLSAQGRKVRLRHSPAPPSGFFSLYSEGLRHLPSSTSGTPPGTVQSHEGQGHRGAYLPKVPSGFLGTNFRSFVEETLSPWEPGMLVLERTLKIILSHPLLRVEQLILVYKLYPKIWQKHFYMRTNAFTSVYRMTTIS